MASSFQKLNRKRLAIASVVPGTLWVAYGLATSKRRSFHKMNLNSSRMIGLAKVRHFQLWTTIMNTKRASIVLAAVVSSLAAADSGLAQTFWTAGTENRFNAGNWTLGVPDAASPTTFDAVIANGGTSQLSAPGGSVRRLRVGRIEGPGSLLVDAGALTVTENLHLNETSAGPAAMTVQNGGTVSSPSTVVAYSGNHPATLAIRGGGSLITTVLNVGQGGSSTGELTVEAGGTVTDTDGFIGRFALSSGMATVRGAGSKWTNSGILRVAHIGQGTLTVEDGGSVSDDFGYIGVGDMANGTVTVRGTNSAWTNSSALFVGQEGTGMLNVETGGRVSTSSATIGVAGGSTGGVLVAGPDSTWANSSGVFVGDSGLGTFRVTAGADATSANAIIGNSPGSSGNVTVDAAGSIWTVQGPLYVGHAGSGSLVIAGGGRITQTLGSAFVGAKDGSYGNVTIQGAGSKWTTAGALILGGEGGTPIGPGGDGYLTIRDRAEVSSNTGYIAYAPGSNSGVSVEGPDSKWTTNELLSVGTSGVGFLNITAGGKVHTTNGDAYVGGAFGAAGSGSALVDGADATWTLAGADPSGMYIGLDGPGTLTVTNGGAVSVAAVNGIQIGAQGIVTGNGTLDARVYNGGTVEPGKAIGTLTIINNPYRQEATGTLKIELASASSYDRLNFPDGGAFLEGGTLDVKLVDGYSPSPGDSFDLMDWHQFGSVTGTFSTLNLPALPGALLWDTSKLYTNGVLSVAVPGPPGDFNQNGVADAADYVVWRNGLGNTHTQDNYNVWRANFGQTGGAGFSNSVGSLENAIPEPASVLLLIAAATFGTLGTSPIRIVVSAPASSSPSQE
jgi:T5SS/PEP-CTERM-associated repeat protein